MFDPILGLGAAPTTPITTICTCSTIKCSCNTATWSISMYSSGSINSNGNGDNDGSSGVGRWKVKTGKVEKAVQLLLSLSYSDIDKILGMC